MIRVGSCAALAAKEASSSADNRVAVAAMDAAREQHSTPAGSSSDCTTMAFITKLALRGNRESRGVWSRFGQPYVPHGKPDLRLAERAHEAKMKRGELRQEIGVTAAAGAGQADTHQTHGKSNAHHHQSPQQQTAKTVAVVPNGSGRQANGRLRREVDMDRYKFPRAQIHDAEQRCRMGRNGNLFARGSDRQRPDAQTSFPRLDLTKVKFADAQQRQCPSETRCTSKILGGPPAPTSYLFATGVDQAEEDAGAWPSSFSASLQGANQAGAASGTGAGAPQSVTNQKPPAARTTYLGEDPAQRWRQKFKDTRMRLDLELQQQLARAKLDRADVLQNRKLIGAATSIATRRAANLCASHTDTSVWGAVLAEQARDKQARLDLLDSASLDDSRRTELYRELEVLAESLCYERGVEVPASADLVRAVACVRELLEARTPLDHHLLFAAMRRLSPGCYQSLHQLVVLRFLRRRCNATLSDISKAGLTIPEAALVVIMSDKDSVHVI
ncbi:unnamed protein product (mitochondrion) [Plasmodiophora brassicae]|uniref:Uncharacterized protein n=1 Tax=Plasmodiophora brassicae TaxID=37360 RepID=A0A0G4IMN2_PLABS|nr:hypothetical protein PBRA_005104 [Plasmodiophora brassicae]SPQ94552.1 unnamed protein product [Plasmodiophora brassicae]